jgi:hypothetical protein
MKLSDRPRRLAGPQHGRFHFGFGRSPWAVRFLLTNDDSDNAFAVYAFMLFEAQRQGKGRAAQTATNSDDVIGPARHEAPPFCCGAMLQPSE